LTETAGRDCEDEKPAAAPRRSKWGSRPPDTLNDADRTAAKHRFNSPEGGRKAS